MGLVNSNLGSFYHQDINKKAIHKPFLRKYQKP